MKNEDNSPLKKKDKNKQIISFLLRKPKMGKMRGESAIVDVFYLMLAPAVTGNEGGSYNYET